MALREGIWDETGIGRTPPPPVVGSVLRDAAACLKDAGIETARLDARCLLGHVLGKDPALLAGSPDDHLSADTYRHFGELLACRLDREPVSRILGTREFWSLSFELTSSVLDPRPDSETVIEAVLPTIDDRRSPLRLLDLGTGSGCLIAALLSELPAASGIGVDIDPDALVVARRNLARHGLSHRVDFVCGDWGAALTGGFDIVVVNPPYIPANDVAILAPEVVRYDPHRALFAGGDGLENYRHLTPGLGRLLRSQGVAAIEIGEGQAEEVATLLLNAGLVPVERRRDLAGVDRCILARPAA